MDDVKNLMTIAAEATLRGDADAVEKANAALEALQDPRVPADRTRVNVGATHTEAKAA